VVDAQQRPVDAATIWLGLYPTRFPAHPAIRVTTSSGDGSFSIRSAASSALISATTVSSGCAWPLLASADPNATQCTVELVVRTDCAALDGVVRTAEGAPLPGALVALSVHRIFADPDFVRLPSLRTRTDAAGRYTFSAVPADRSISVLALAGSQPSATAKTVLQAGEPAHLDISLPRGVIVRGIVTDAAGAPLSNASLYDRTAGTSQLYRDLVRTNYTRSGADGSFELIGLDPGKLDLEASAKIDGESRRVTIQLTTEDASVHVWNPSFVDGWVVHGVVRDLTGTPLRDWRVSVTPADGLDELLPQPVATDADGAFKIRNLRDTSYVLSITLPDRQTLVERREGVRPGPEPFEFALAVPSNAPCFVHGRALASDGTALSGAMVIVSYPLKSSQRRGTTAADGSFRVQAPQFGEQVLYVRADSIAEIRMPVHALASGEDRDLGTITADASGSLEVDCRLMDGSALIYPMIVLEGHGILEQVEGFTFRSKQLVPGTYHLFPEANNIVTTTRDVDVTCFRKPTTS
jgi:hypothetical protein